MKNLLKEYWILLICILPVIGWCIFGGAIISIGMEGFPASQKDDALIQAELTQGRFNTIDGNIIEVPDVMFFVGQNLPMILIVGHCKNIIKIWECSHRNKFPQILVAIFNK